MQHRSLFDALRRPNGRASRGPIRVSFIRAGHGNSLTRPCVAYAIDKRCGNAVHRNLLRRRLRAIVSEVVSDLSPGAYLVRTEPAAQDLSFQELRLVVAQTVIAAGVKGS